MKNAVAVVGTILVLFVCACGQVSRPTFSGMWKLAPHLSRFSPYSDKTATDTCRLKLAEPKLEILHTYSGKLIVKETALLVLDGKERYINPSGKVTAQAYWDGDAIVVKKRQELAKGASAWTLRYSLSAEGRQLTISAHMLDSLISPEFDEVLVYERQ